MEHLSDTDIQNYLDGTDLRRREIVRRHLLSCDKCREEAAAYRQLHSLLATEPEFSFPESALETVMSRLADSQREQKPAWWEPPAVIGALTALLALLGFGFSGSLHTILLPLSQSFSDSWLVLLRDIRSFVQGLNLNSWVLATIFLVLLLTGVLDYVLRPGRPRGIHAGKRAV